MANTKITKWLEEKRRQQGSQMGGMLGMAPSPMQRYGWDPVSQQPTPQALQSGKYTGLGGNGRLERTMPTERRVDVNGRPYGVDEGEVVVNDAPTVQAYGGAQNLDRMIQANRPDGMARPTTPAQGQPPVPQMWRGGARMMPQESQAQMQADMRNMGMRRFAVGGVAGTTYDTKYPTNTRAKFGENPVGTQTKAAPGTTLGVRPEEVQYDAAGNRIESVNPLERTGTILDPGWSTNQYGETTKAAPVKTTPQNFISPDAKRTTIAAPELKPTPGVPPVPSTTPGTVPSTTPGAAPAGTPVFSPTTQDQAALNYYLPRLTASQQAERAAEAQAAMQQGASAETVRGTQAVSDVGRRTAVGEAVAKFADDAATRAEERYKWEKSFGLQQKAFDFAREKYGDEETTRLAQDIKNGLTFDQLKTKYPSLSQEDFTKMDTVLNSAVKAEMRSQAFSATKGYVSQNIATNPEYLSSGAWKTDAAMINNLSSQWTAEGNDEPFDMNNLAHAAWASTQVDAAAVTPEELAINTYKASKSYQNLSADDKREMDLLLNTVGALSVTQGFQLHENTDGSVYITDSEGGVVYGEKQITEGGGTGSDITTQDTASVVTSLKDNGITADPIRARQWLEANPGVTEPTPEQWMAWDSTTENTANITKFLNGDLSVMLSRADNSYMDEVISAQAAVKAGTATDEQKAVASSIPIDMVKLGWGSTTNETTPEWSDYVSHVGVVHSYMKYNDDVYNKSSDRILRFEPDVVEWAKANAGSVVMIEGKPYLLNAANPIVDKTETKTITSGDDTYDKTFTYDSLNLIDLSDNTQMQWTFGATSRLWD